MTRSTKTKPRAKAQSPLDSARQHLRSRTLKSDSTVFYFSPSPKHRKQGWSGFDYLRLDGTPKSAGEAIDAHAATLALLALGGHRARAVSGLADLDENSTTANGNQGSTINNLLDQWLHSTDIVTLRPKSIADYRTKANWIRRVYGDQPASALTDRQRLKQFHWIIRITAGRTKDQARANMAALQKSNETGKAFTIPDTRDALPMAAGVMRTLSAFASWLHNEGKIANQPITKAGGGSGLRLPTPEPRIRIIHPDQIAALMAQAEQMGMIGIADFIALALSTAQRVGDVLALSVALTEIRRGEKRLVLLATKNKRVVDMPYSKRLEQRTSEILARRADIHTSQHNILSGAPYVLRHPNQNAKGPSARQHPKPYTAYSDPVREFDRDFKRVVDATAQKQGYANVADIRASDLRDTAITRMADAGCTIPLIASISNHSLASITRVMQHYLATTAQQANAATEALEAYLDRFNIAY